MTAVGAIMAGSGGTGTGSGGASSPDAPSGGSFSVALSPTAVTGRYSGASGAAQNIATANVLAGPSGGVLPYTYLWTQPTATPYTWIISAPATAQTKFTAQAVDAGVITSATFKVTVTDSIGGTAFNTITATVTNASTA